jgi:hypothetical protein
LIGRDLFGFEIESFAQSSVASFANFSFAYDVGSNEDFGPIRSSENLCPRSSLGVAELNGKSTNEEQGSQSERKAQPPSSASIKGSGRHED